MLAWLTGSLNSVFQSLGGALIVSAAQSIFQNELLQSLLVNSPNIDPTTVFNTGASKIQTTFSHEDLIGIDASYMKGLHTAFALAIPMAGIATLVAIGQKWFRLNVPGDETKTRAKPDDSVLPQEK